MVFYIYEFALPLTLGLFALYLANPERRDAFGMDGITFFNWALIGPACMMIGVTTGFLVVLLFSVFYGAMVYSVISLTLNSVYLLSYGTILSDLAGSIIQGIDSEMLMGAVFFFFVAEFYLILARMILNRWSLKGIASIVDPRGAKTLFGRFVMFAADAAFLLALLKVLAVFLIIWNAFNTLGTDLDYSKAPLTGTVAFLVTVVPVLFVYHGIPFLLRRYNEKLSAGKRWWGPRPDPNLRRRDLKTKHGK